jgi:hypothetical protein
MKKQHTAPPALSTSGFSFRIANIAAAAVTATVITGSFADHAAITWAAPKVAGQVIVSVSKSSGRTCNTVNSRLYRNHQLQN